MIHPYGCIALDPSIAVFHHALECFEGMKAYIDAEGHVRLFCPDMDIMRLHNAMKRLLLPEFDGDEFLKCLAELIRLDKDWVPMGGGYSLYIRATGISTQALIGVGIGEKATLFIFLSSVGPKYPKGFNPVKLCANDQYIHAWPGGTRSEQIMLPGYNYNTLQANRVIRKICGSLDVTMRSQKSAL